MSANLPFVKRSARRFRMAGGRRPPPKVRKQAIAPVDTDGKYAYNVTMATSASRAAESASTAPRRSRQSARRGRLKRRLKTAFALLFLSAEVVVALSLVTAVVVFWRFSRDLPNFEGITDNMGAPVATKIWSQDGVLLGKLDIENRQPILLREMPKHLLDATVAIEDRRFYEHPGVDMAGIGRAVFANLRGANSTIQGASTLTQQLVRNMSQFGISKEKRMTRKVREALIALRVEQLYRKDEILQLYLNEIYYGAGSYGVEAAAKTFFGKPARRLNLAEAALIAGLPQRPRRYSPFEHPRAAILRRDEVLDRMRDYAYITPAQCEQAKTERPRFVAHRPRRSFEFKAPHFTNYVLRTLVREYGVDYVLKGLKVETTLSWKQQSLAEKALRNGLAHGSGYGANQGALVAIDNNTGFVRALVGGRDFHADQFNAITQGRRQPGSTFKVFDYTAAFDLGKADLHTAFRDEPIPYPNDPEHRIVKNYGGRYSHRAIDCLSAIKFSKNTIAVQVARSVGIRQVIEYAHRMGVTTPLAPYLPTALGASEVRPIDLCSAYSIFARKGSRAKPMAIVRIRDADGNILHEFSPEVEENILRPETVDMMNQALEAVVTGGTGTRARGTQANGIVENARGKTGTTSDNRDAWFAGYTPELTTVIWVASAHRARSGKLRYAEMHGATGGALCAPIWHDFMVEAVPEQRKFRGPDIQAAGRQTQQSLETSQDEEDREVAARRRPRPRRHTSHTNSPELAVPREVLADPDASSVPNTPSAPAPETGVTPAPLEGPSSPGRDEASVDRGGRRGRPDAVPPGGGAPVAHSARSEETESVTVTLCAVTGARATTWCSATIDRKLSARQARSLARCRRHRAPPGEEDRN